MTIAEVSKKYDITPDTLRYYEKIGLLPSVPRVNGIRNYDETSLGWVELMKCMRSAGVQVEALARYVELFKEGDSTVDERKNILMEQREILKEKMKKMQKSLDKLNEKIEKYEQGLMIKEKQLQKGASKRAEK